MNTIPHVVRRAAANHGQLEALVDGERRWTFDRLHLDVRRAASAFVSSGLRHGDRVAIWAPNSAEWMIAALGAQYVGGVLVPVNTRFKGHEAADLLTRSRARFLIVANDFLDTDYCALLRDFDLPDLVARVVVSGSVPDDGIAWHDFVSHDVDDVIDRRADAVSEDDLCDIIFTSGTTGRPKGVMSRHGQTCAVFTTWSDVVGLTTGDRYLVVNPFFHTFGYKAGFLSGVLTGSTILPVAIFDVPTVLRMVADERITVLPGPPTLYLSILDHPNRDEHDLSSLRTAVTGAAAVPVTMIERMRRELTFRTVLTAYGLTESTGVVTMCRRDDDAHVIATTSGRAIPGVEVRIVDDDGHDAPPGTPGEIVCRGYNVMPGYFEDPVATAETIDAQGWLHTGDIGVIDESGNVAITDRKKDMFIVGGFNAYPAEIENSLLRHPSIAMAAVVGVPDERLGEVGWAFVVPRSGRTIDGDDVVTWARGEMANYKVPRRVVVVDRLPTNASGKVLKFELRRRAAEDRTDPI
ncbi:MAG: hypothetical protein RL547_1689 [Actinomycetota bacterium]